MYAYIDSFRKFGKTNTDNQSIKIKRPYPKIGREFFHGLRNGTRNPWLGENPLRRRLQHRLDLRRLDRHIGHAVVVARRDKAHGTDRPVGLERDAALLQIADTYIRLTVVGDLGVPRREDRPRQVPRARLEVYFAAPAEVDLHDGLRRGLLRR